MDLVQACGNYPDLLEEILTGLQQAVIISDLDGQILMTSSIVEKVIGYRPEELRDEYLSIIFTPEDLAYLYPNLLYLARKGQPYEGEVLLKRKDLSRFFAFLVIRPCVNTLEGRTILAVCIQDIEKQKQFEQALRETRFEDLVKIANGIAHELRNPLVGIGGFAGRLFKSCNASEEQEKYYEYIVQNLQRIENLIKKVDLLVSLPRPYFRPESVFEMAEAAAEPLMPAIKSRGLDLVIDMDQIELIVDKDLVVRAVAILLENAIDAVEDGGKIEIKSSSVDNQCELCVADEGKGIPPAELPFIFNPFYTTKPTGAGIDLAVVKRIMESHGGQVIVKSTPGQGSVFSLKFPFERRRTIRVEHLSNL